jgi:hypothetical protein
VVPLLPKGEITTSVGRKLIPRPVFRPSSVPIEPTMAANDFNVVARPEGALPLLSLAVIYCSGIHVWSVKEAASIGE